MADSYDSDRPEGERKFDTLCVHHGQSLDPENRARAPPIYASTSFVFKNAEHGANLFALKELGPIYSRIMNPTNHVLEYRIAKLEGAKCELDGAHPSSLATSSGQAAQMHAIFTLAGAGDNIIAGNQLYGGTHAQFKHTFRDLGLQVKFFDATKPELIEALIDGNTKAIYLETLSNPSYDVPDFDVISAIAKKHQLPLVVDNTFGMCGYVCRPIKFGADIVTESCTKWIGGHGNTIGGVITDSGNFDWSAQVDGKSKFPKLNDPCEAYHGMNFNAVFGPTGPFKVNMPFIFHARTVALRDMGACQNPFGAFQLLMGLETLPLRAERHCQNANKLAAYLEAHEEVDWVCHPSLKSHSSHERAKKYFRKDCFGSVLSFGLKGDGKARAVKFIDNLKLVSLLANVGDSKTLAIHPGSTTHQQLSDEDQLAAGVKPSMIRISVGIETFEDIQDDIAQAIAAA